MPLTGNAAAQLDSPLHGDPRWALVERIAGSPHLKPSSRLCQFLFYVAECAIREVPEEATEQQIGIRVFGRPPGYNSSEDSIVRTHARLLRQKLAAYFAEEGIAEPIVVEVPKGHYLPTFHLRDEGTTSANKPSALQPAEVPRKDSALAGHSAPGHRAWNWAVAWVVLPALLAIGLLLWHPWNKPLVAETAVDTFWRPFLTTEPPIVIFSNALFEGDSKNGLRYATLQDSNKASDGSLVDTYTGIGELASVYNLTRLFDAHRASFILKRSLLVTWDEAQLRNLIFIGSRARTPPCVFCREQPTSPWWPLPIRPGW